MMIFQKLFSKKKRTRLGDSTPNAAAEFELSDNSELVESESSEPTTVSRRNRRPSKEKSKRQIQTKSSSFFCLTDFDAEQFNGSKKILLAGQTVFAALSEDGHPESFVQQAPREGTSYLRSLLRKTSPRVYVSVDERLFSIRSRFAFAIDGYLSWGISASAQSTVILLGGGKTTAGTSVNVITFQNGVVEEIGEKNLPASSDPLFQDAVNSMLSGLRGKYPSARIVLASPLENWSVPGVEYIGDKPLKRLSYRPLVQAYKPSRKFAVPAAISVLGMGVYSAALGIGWSNYQGALQEYEKAISTAAVKDQGGIDTNFLDVMNARRFYMEQPRRQIRLTQESMRVVRGIGVIDNVQIVEIKLPAPSIGRNNQAAGTLVNPEHVRARQQIMPNRTPDVWMSISVPSTHDTAITQAKDVMTKIANSTGMSLRLAHQGWKEESKSKQDPRRIFSIEGFIHD